MITKELFQSMRQTLDAKAGFQGRKNIARGGMFLENRIYSSEHLKRIHIEHVRTTPEFYPPLSVFHCTMFPDLKTDLNVVLGFDLVEVAGVHTLAIADPTIVYGEDWHQEYSLRFNGVRDIYWSDADPLTRPLPDWGLDFFSDGVVYLGAPIDTTRFCEYTVDLSEMHLDYSPRACSKGLSEKWTGIAQYCRTQRGNKKTEQMLAKALGPTLAKVYMKSMMFSEDIYIC